MGKAIKFEARNSKFETISNHQISNGQDKFKTFGFRKFEFVSDFDIRISDLVGVQKPIDYQRQ